MEPESRFRPRLSPWLCLPFSDSALRPVAVVFIELPLPIIYTASIHICIITVAERSDEAIIGSWPSVCKQALPDQKNLLSETLDIVTVFYHCDTSDVTQHRGWVILVCSFVACSLLVYLNLLNFEIYPGQVRSIECRFEEDGSIQVCST
jgi:hypothetical protein